MQRKFTCGKSLCSNRIRQGNCVPLPTSEVPRTIPRSLFVLRTSHFGLGLKTGNQVNFVFCLTVYFFAHWCDCTTKIACLHMLHLFPGEHEKEKKTCGEMCQKFPWSDTVRREAVVQSSGITSLAPGTFSPLATPRMTNIPRDAVLISAADFSWKHTWRNTPVAREFPGKKTQRLIRPWLDFMNGSCIFFPWQQA